MAHALWCAGCWFSGETAPPTEAVATGASRQLPEEPSELYALAERRNRLDGRLPDIRVAVDAYEKLLGMVFAGYDVGVIRRDIRWRLMVACFNGGELASVKRDKLKWYVKGERLADAYVGDYPQRVEGYYYAALFKGRRAELAAVGFSALRLVGRIEELGLEAARIDASFHHGGPLRFLAMLYARAPAWPTGVGDMDKAIAYVEEAIAISDYPMNYLIMAEVCIEDDDMACAISALDVVLAAPFDGLWAQEGAYWRSHALSLRGRIENSTL